MPEDTNDTATTVEAQDADTTTTTPGLSQEDAAREVKKLREENAKWRTKLREREEADKAAAEAKRQAELTLEQRVKEAEAKAAEAMTAAEKRIQAAEQRASLTGKVADPQAAMRLLEETHVRDDGTIDVDALLKTYPFLAATQAPGAFIASGAPLPARTKDPSRMTDDEFFRSRTQSKE